MNNEIAFPRHTIFLYTEEDNGGRLIESPVIGLINDYSETGCSWCGIRITI